MEDRVFGDDRVLAVNQPPDHDRIDSLPMLGQHLADVRLYIEGAAADPELRCVNPRNRYSAFGRQPASGLYASSHKRFASEWDLAGGASAGTSAGSGHGEYVVVNWSSGQKLPPVNRSLRLATCRPLS